MTTAAVARSHYATQSVTTASPARLLVMLYDRLVRDLVQAEEAITTGRIAVANEQLQHAQQIILELNTSLDRDAWSGAEGLSQLYDFLHAELLAANTSKDAARVSGVRELVVPLQDAWRQAALATAAGT